MLMLPIQAYVASCTDALLFHHVMAQLIIIQLNLTLIKLEQICWLSHGATESSSPVQPHLPGWGGPNSVYCHASHRGLQLGKVMCARCPGLVGVHNLVCPSCVVPGCPHLGRVRFVLPRGGRMS